MHVAKMMIGSASCGALYTESPTIEDVKLGIQQLDGDDRSEFGLFTEDGDYFQIGGGPQLFVVGCRIGDVLNIPYNPDIPEDQVEWIYEGQGADYPRNECLSLNEVTQAACRFALTGELDPALAWHSM